MAAKHFYRGEWGEIGESHYVSEDGGPRLMGSVIYAVNETQKPEAIVDRLAQRDLLPANGQNQAPTTARLMPATLLRDRYAVVGRPGFRCKKT